MTNLCLQLQPNARSTREPKTNSRKTTPMSFNSYNAIESELTTSGRTVEENALARRHAKLEELVRVFDRVLDQLLELLLDRRQPSDVVPRDVRHLDHRLSERRWCRFSHREPEVRHCHGQRVQHLSGSFCYCCCFEVFNIKHMNPQRILLSATGVFYWVSGVICFNRKNPELNKPTFVAQCNRPVAPKS